MTYSREPRRRRDLKADVTTREQETFPKLARANAARMPDRVAIREKDYGIWQSTTWGDHLAQASANALGLSTLGCGVGDKVAIVGHNRPQLYWAVLATQALGGVPVPLYQDSIEKEMEYIVDHAEARFAIVEDQEQVDKLLALRPRCPRLETIVYDDPRGLRAYSETCLMSLAELQEAGRKFDIGHPTYFDEELARGRGEDVAIICYTSGTTGTPKGAMLSHRNLIVTARNAAEAEGLQPDEEILSYLPMAWVGDHVFSYAQAILVAFAINCPESAATVLSDLREIGPTYFFAPPRIWESLRINVKQLYGMTEASVFVTIQRDGDVRLDSVGTPIKDVELKISPEGEVLYRSPGIFQGYYKNEAATRQVMLEGGWMRSGDAGFLDAAGQLKIIDRAQDLSRLSDGTIFAPKYIENKLKFSPYVKEAVCIGQDRPYVGQTYAALIDALYGPHDRAQVEAKVTYEDGRVGMVRADVRICEVGAARTTR